MASGADASETKPKPARTAFAAYFHPRVLFMLALGFSSGLPFMLVGSTLAFWLRQDHISRTSIGLMSAATFAYAIKVIWSPLVDRVRLPWLDKKLGKRRAWILLSQIFVAAGLLALAFGDPAKNLYAVAVIAVFTGFASATQDIAIDAWRIEAASSEQQGAMAAVYQLGYRLALLAAGAGALVIADRVSWQMAYICMAALMLLGFLAVVFAPTPKQDGQAIPGAEAVERLAEEMHLQGTMARTLAWLYSAIVAPFVDFVARHRWKALVILALVGAYRIPDFVMGVMASALYIDLGFTLTAVAAIVKTFGIGMTIAGALIGGLAVARLGIMRTLLVGILASIAGNLVFAWLATQGSSMTALTVAISCENFAGGFAGTALIAYMSSLTSTAFTATQYALFTSAYALPGKLIGLASGLLVDWFAAHPSLAATFGAMGAKAAGYVPFFISTAAMGIPALVLVLYVARMDGPATAER